MGVASTYFSHVALTAWRRKSALLGAALALVLLGLCVQYSATIARQDAVAEPGQGSDLPSQRHSHRNKNDDNEVRPAEALVLPLENGHPHGGLREINNVRFVHSNFDGGSKEAVDGNSQVKEADVIPKIPAEQPSRDDLIRRQLALEQYAAARRDTDAVLQPSAININIPQQSLAPPVQVSTGGSEVYNKRQGDSEDVQKTRYVTKGNGQYEAEVVNNGYYQGDGLVYPGFDPNKPYVPPSRIVHLDLKGAPPKVSYLKRIFPMIKQLGATGVLLEWEDMFPFKDPMGMIPAKNHYSRREIRTILELVRANDLEVIPLVQTFGHLEFALKHSAFSHIREVPEIPQAICPSLNESMVFIENMIDQVMAYHKGIRFLHIGCDEVYNLGECPRCRQHIRDNLFLSHVAKVARYVRNTYNVTPLIWDDMLRHILPQTLDEFKIGELVEPMVWVYAEDVYRFVPSMVWDKFALVFPTVWTASAFKGAFGETMYVPNVKRHLENNMRWLEVMATEGPKFKNGFRGIVLTGWQRYDHFSVLCELLPAALPSLAVNLLATSHGYFNASLKQPLYTALGCTQTPKYGTFLNLNSDMFLWDKFSWCFFPGAHFFKVTYRLHSAEKEVDEFVKTVTKSKGWMTDYNIRHNFSTPLRVDELMMEHPRIMHLVVSLLRSARDSLAEVFDVYTVGEWIELRVYPMLKKLEDIQKEAVQLKSFRIWPARPFPILPDLKKHGISLPEDDSVQNTAGGQKGRGRSRTAMQPGVPTQ